MKIVVDLSPELFKELSEASVERSKKNPISIPELIAECLEAGYLQKDLGDGMGEEKRAEPNRIKGIDE